METASSDSVTGAALVQISDSGFWGTCARLQRSIGVAEGYSRSGDVKGLESDVKLPFATVKRSLKSSSQQELLNDLLTVKLRLTLAAPAS